MLVNEHARTASIPIPRHYTGPLVKEVGAEIGRLFDDGRIRELVLDFSASELVDSCAIGTLVSLAKESQLRHVNLVLKNLNDDLYQLFNHTGLDRIFTIERQEVLTAATVDFIEPSVDIKLGIDKEFISDIAVFHLCGVMNHPIGSGYLKQQLLLSLMQYKKILLDMEDLTFIDSLSLSGVLSLNNLLVDTGGSLRICRANYIVLDLLETLKIGAFIPMFTSLDEAIASWDGLHG
jgi:anti-anti-sigma factor